MISNKISSTLWLFKNPVPKVAFLSEREVKKRTFSKISAYVLTSWQETVQGDKEPSNNLPKSPFHVLPKETFNAAHCWCMMYNRNTQWERALTIYKGVCRNLLASVVTVHLLKPLLQFIKSILNSASGKTPNITGVLSAPLLIVSLVLSVIF